MLKYIGMNDLECIVHVTVIFMHCSIACDSECWKSVGPQSTQSEIAELKFLAPAQIADDPGSHTAPHSRNTGALRY